MEKDRNRRYQSASDFSEDVQRYLNDEPVQACPPTLAYRCTKFVRRNRGLIGAASRAAIFILVAAILLWNERSRTLAALDGEKFQRREAEKNLELANGQTAAAEANLQTAIDAVDQMLARVGISTLKDVPELTSVRAELLKDADRFFEALLERDPNNPEIRFQRVKTEVEVADISRTGWEGLRRVVSPTAIATLEELVSEFPDNLRYKKTLANAWLLRANQSHLSWMGVSLEEALVLSRNAIRICEELYSTHTQDDSYRVQLAKCYHQLAATLYGLQRYAESEEQARYAIESLGYENWLAYKMLAQAQHKAGRLAEADESYGNAIRLWREELQWLPRQTELKVQAAATLRGYGELLVETERYERAKECFLEALKISLEYEEEYSARHAGWYTSSATQSLINYYLRVGEPDAIERLAEELNPKTGAEFLSRACCNAQPEIESVQ